MLRIFQADDPEYRRARINRRSIRELLLGFFVDIGAAYQGEPELELVATGNATTLPGFNQNLEQERQAIEEDLGKYFKFYPVISVGISIGIPMS